MVLAHERAHLKRGDQLWKPLGFLLLTAYWFNPVCWLAYILFCRDIEAACDEKVVRELGDDCKTAYSRALLQCSACSERCAGVSYYRWLRELEQNFDARADELIEMLRTLCEKLFVTARMRLSVTGGGIVPAAGNTAGDHAGSLLDDRAGEIYYRRDSQGLLQGLPRH